MGRITLGELLSRNPTYISCDNLMPDYYVFQTLDSTSIPIETYDRMNITLVWERIGGDELTQLMNIIDATQGETRAVTELDYDDNHILQGEVVILDASVRPFPMTGGYYNGIYIPLQAEVTIVVSPNDYTFLQVI